MVLHDFEYRGELASAHELMIGYIDGGGDNEVSLGAEYEAETVTNSATQKIQTLNVKYETPITAEFSILKNNCLSGENYFTDIEVSWIMNWLHSETNQKFIPIYDDDSFPDVWYKGRFSPISAIQLYGHVVGFNVTFTADAAWGYGNQVTRTITGGGDFTIDVVSDKSGYLYPDSVTATMTNDGTFELKRKNADGTDILNEIVSVTSCASNEVLTFDSVNQIISTSLTTHERLYNDFNYVFPRLNNEWNSYGVCKNYFSSSANADITIKYTPVRKVGIVV